MAATITASASSAALAGQRVFKQRSEVLKAAGSSESKLQRRSKASSSGSIWYGADRPKYLGPFSGDAPSYLKGEFAGDYGWAPPACPPMPIPSPRTGSWR